MPNMDDLHQKVDRICLDVAELRINRQMEVQNFKDLKADVTEIKTCIIGNEVLGHKGLVKRITAIEDSDAAQNRTLIKWGGIVSGVSLTLGWVGFKIGSIFSK